MHNDRSTLSIQEVDRAEISNDHLRSTLLKPPEIRSYDDLLLLKSFMMRTEFVIRHLDRIVNPRQMDELCRNIGIEMFNEGGIVFNQGDIGDKVYIMLEGSVDLKIRYRINLMQGESEMREKFIKTYDVRGSCFGERALQNDELRSGTVVATTLTTLITVAKDSYAAAIRDAKIQNDGISRDKLGTKESVITILSKMREKRSNQELEGVASYLHYRIPFFQKFSMPQLVELCRVSDIITSWSRSILFKQGSIGQAFYVILTGTVEVWTQASIINSNSRSPSMYNSTSQLGFQAIHQMNSNNYNNNKLIPRINDITEGLGTKVSELNTGETFGERALENEDSLRMASIISCDGNTELIVISKEDYHNLVYVMMHAETMSRITLLRKTDLFRSIDVGHLKGLAKYMELRKYKLNEVIYATGSKASEMIIIESGECQVETEIKEYKDMSSSNNSNSKTKKGTNKMMTSTPNKIVVAAATTDQATTVSKEGSSSSDAVEKQQQLQLPQIILRLQSKKLEDSFSSSPQQQLVGPAMKLNLGRVGPNSVLATYITSLTLSDEVIHPETLIASTPVVAYSISKHDYYNYLHKETRFFIDRLVMNYKKPVLGFLWQSSPKIIDENSWKKEQTWKKFKEDLMNDPKRQANIMDAYKLVGNIRLTEDSGNSKNTIIAQRNAAILKAREAFDTGKHVTVDMNWGLPAGWNQSNNGSTIVSDENSSEKSNSIAGSRIDSPGGRGGGGEQLYNSKAVSKLIRKRINNNNIENNILKKEFISIHSLEQPSTLTKPLFDDINNNYNIESKRAFTLIQIHRESIKSNAHGGLLDGRKKMVRCYLRICGVYESTEIAKAVADSQMENIYLTLYRSDPTREKELLLHWNIFKGYDNISLSNTDHFMIYCKSAPVMYASLTPSKNIFNSLFPALCKQPNQRYACVVISKLKDNIHPTTSSNNNDTNNNNNYNNNNSNNNNNIKRDSSNEIVSDSSDSDESIKDRHMIMAQQGINDKRPKRQLLKSNKSTSPRVISNNKNNNTNQSKTTSAVGGQQQQQQQQQIRHKDGMISNNNNDNNSGVNKSTVVATNSSTDVNDYLLEFSALSEVLFVTPNRLPCLRYAITRFGTMTDPTLYVPDDSSSSSNGGKDGSKMYQQQDDEAPTRAINSVLQQQKQQQSHMYIKKPYENPSDRVLVDLSTGNKRICIIPLFNWILINDETIQTLDFLNCFNEQSQQMIFLQEELEHNRIVASTTTTTSLMGSALSTIGTKTNITKDKLENSNNNNNNLYKVFNEVDLLETDKLMDNLTKSNQKYTLQKASTNAMEHAIITNKSLKMLETELTSKELNINVKATVVKMKHKAMEEAENTRNTMNSYDSAKNDNNNNNDDISIVEMAQLQINARLSSLNTTVSAQLKVVDNHNELCEIEHKAFENDFSPTKPSTSKEQTEKLIENRMGIIDHLQKLRFEKITLETVINNYNAQRYKSLILDETHNTANGGGGGGGISSASVEEEQSPTSTAMRNKNRLKTFNNLPSSSSNGTTNVNAGKRLAESIQALAETLNAKAKY